MNNVFKAKICKRRFYYQFLIIAILMYGKVFFMIILNFMENFGIILKEYEVNSEERSGLCIMGMLITSFFMY